MQLLTYGRRIPLAELFARIDAVDASTVKRVANRFIYDRVRPTICYNTCVVSSFYRHWILRSCRSIWILKTSFSTGCCYCCHGSHSELARLQLVQTQDILEQILDVPRCLNYFIIIDFHDLFDLGIFCCFYATDSLSPLERAFKASVFFCSHKYVIGSLYFVTWHFQK